MTRKSDFCGAEVEFWRPCRGRSPGKGFAPKTRMYYMTRRAFLALRVILLQEEFAFQLFFQRIWFGVRFCSVFQIILAIHEFVCDGVAKINYFDMKGIHFTWGLWKSIGSRRRILTICNSILGRNFRKSDVCEAEVKFWRPCRGRSPFQGWAPGRAAKIRLRLRRRHFFENFGPESSCKSSKFDA